MLALSQAGGIAGERTLPLLVDDSDWDRLGDRMPPLVGELEDQELTQLLLALQGLRPVDIARAQKHEARNLAANLLTAIARRWDQNIGRCPRRCSSTGTPSRIGLPARSKRRSSD